MREALRDAQRNVAAPHQQHALHHAVGVEIGPAVNAPARASRNPAQEPSMTIPCAESGVPKIKKRMKSGVRQGARPKRTAWYGEAEQRSMASGFAANYRVNF